MLALLTLDLNGTWWFAIDQDPEYHRQLDYSRPTSLRHWEAVAVPGCWNLYAERYDLFEGVAWLVREFTVGELPPEPVATLRFGAINYLAEVYLNGRHLASHEGGYTAFEVDATPALQEGVNRLAVRVDNRHLRLRLPAVIGWYNYGGIHREVCLHLTSRVQIEAVNLSLKPCGSGAEGTLEVTARPARSKLHLVAGISDPQGQVVWEGRAAGRGEWVLEVAFDPAQRWSPAHPAQYRCEVELWCEGELLDRRGCPAGVRRVTVDGQRLLLNGEPLYLRGMCYLYDHPACGVTYDPAVAARDLDDLQALGVNCLRSHFPLPEAFLDECDRRGLMLWLEAPIYCVHPASDQCATVFAEGGLEQLARQMLREMVQQARNHPSVIIWSVGNECNSEHPESLAFFTACVQEVRTLDPTRLISYAALYGRVGCLADLVDLVSVNEYWGWYDRISHDGTGGQEPLPDLPIDLPELEECLAGLSALQKPLLLSEFGADAEPGFYSAPGALWSEEYQAEVLQRQLEVAARYPAVCGAFPFLYNDYRDPSKPVNHYWHGINLKGLVTYDRRRKLAWERVRDIYHEGQP